MKKLKIKSSWSEVNLREFLEYAKITAEETAEDDEGNKFIRYPIRYRFRLAALFSGCEIEDLEEYPGKDIMNAVSFIDSDPPENKNKTFKVDGVDFMWHPDFNNLKAGEQLSFEQLAMDAQDEGRNVLPELLAILVRPEVGGEIEKFSASKIEERVVLFQEHLTADKFIHEVNFIMSIAEKSGETTPSSSGRRERRASNRKKKKH